MRSDLSFEREHVVDVDAAVVGISRQRWSALTPDEAADLDRARAVMKENGFDVMPVEDDDGEVRSYVTTAAWGDFRSPVERHDIGPQDIIPQRTPLEEVLRGFAEDGRDFYFLSSYGRITGLITIVNLNCRQVRVFLYGLICEFETVLGDLIREAIGPDKLTVDKILSELSEGRADVKDGFDEARGANLDTDITEFLYLTDLIKVVRRHGLFGPLGFEHRGRFKDTFSHLNETRKRVAHPTRALIEKRGAVVTLWEDVKAIERALSAFRQGGHATSA